MRALVGSLGLVLAFASPARAERAFLPGPARELPLTESASRDAPLFEYAHGRRAYGSLGLAPAVVAFRGETSTFRVGFSALFAWENDGGTSLLPRSLLWREREALSLSFARRELAGELEFALELGHEGAHRDVGSNVDAWRPFDIAFGAGGWFVAPDVAFARRVTPRLRVTTRLGDRLFVNAFPRVVGAREASDFVADYLGEGLTQAPFADLIWRYAASPRVAPLFALHGEVLVPHDDSARSGVRARAVAGVAFSGRTGELVPFAAVDAGNGYGYFVNRRELQLSLGVRLSFDVQRGRR